MLLHFNLDLKCQFVDESVKKFDRTTLLLMGLKKGIEEEQVEEEVPQSPPSPTSSQVPLMLPDPSTHSFHSTSWDYSWENVQGNQEVF